MTVKEMIAELIKFDGDLEVFTEGCDCVGNTESIELYDNGVIINRPRERKQNEHIF